MSVMLASNGQATPSAGASSGVLWMVAWSRLGPKLMALLATARATAAQLGRYMGAPALWRSLGSFGHSSITPTQVYAKLVSPWRENPATFLEDALEAA